MPNLIIYASIHFSFIVSMRGWKWNGKSSTHITGKNVEFGLFLLWYRMNVNGFCSIPETFLMRAHNRNNI